MVRAGFSDRPPLAGHGWSVEGQGERRTGQRDERETEHETERGQLGVQMSRDGQVGRGSRTSRRKFEGESVLGAGAARRSGVASKLAACPNSSGCDWQSAGIASTTASMREETICGGWDGRKPGEGSGRTGFSLIIFLFLIFFCLDFFSSPLCVFPCACLGEEQRPWLGDNTARATTPDRSARIHQARPTRCHDALVSSGCALQPVLLHRRPQERPSAAVEPPGGDRLEPTREMSKHRESGGSKPEEMLKEHRQQRSTESMPGPAAPRSLPAASVVSILVLSC